MDTGGGSDRHRPRSVPLTSPAEVSTPIDVLVTWHEGAGLPEDWGATVATWPDAGGLVVPGGPLHHARAIHDGTTVGVHVASTRRDGQLHSVWCAVAPEWRGRGLAQRLVARHWRWGAQHERPVLRAHTPAECPAMLVVHLKAGLSVLGSFTDADGVVFVILRGRAG